MTIIQPKIEVPDEIYSNFLEGKVDIMGLAKNAENGQIVKHLDIASGERSDVDKTVTTSKSYDENASDDNDAAGAILIIALCVAAVTGMVAGGIWLFKKIGRKKLDVFKKCLNEYIMAVNEQRLTVDNVEKLCKAMDALKNKHLDSLKIEFTGEELFALVECLCKHTQNMVDLNHCEIEVAFSEEEQNNIWLKLRKNLEYQKAILNLAA